MSGNFVTPSYLIEYSRPASFDDYRCVVNAAGTNAIFERSPITKSGRAKKKDSSLYILDLTDPRATAKTFLPPAAPIVYSNRPDWSWQTAGSVAFNWGRNKGLGIEVGIADSAGDKATRLKGTAGMEYPTWFPDQTLAVAYSRKDTPPQPNTTHIEQDGKNATIIRSALGGPTYWAGMPSVNQASPNLIAFAGQTVAKPPAKYNQDDNYIWVMDISKESVSVVPLEDQSLSSGPFNPAFQARAPWWSPDGNWIVFESTRASAGSYAIFLYKYGGSSPAVQVTDPMYNMNHAKWFPDGFLKAPGDPKLIVAAYQADGSSAALPYGIATLDVSAFV